MGPGRLVDDDVITLLSNSHTTSTATDTRLGQRCRRLNAQLECAAPLEQFKSAKDNNNNHNNTMADVCLRLQILACARTLW